MRKEDAVKLIMESLYEAVHLVGGKPQFDPKDHVNLEFFAKQIVDNLDEAGVKPVQQVVVRDGYNRPETVTKQGYAND